MHLSGASLISKYYLNHLLSLHLLILQLTVGTNAFKYIKQVTSRKANTQRV